MSKDLVFLPFHPSYHRFYSFHFYTVFGIRRCYYVRPLQGCEEAIKKGITCSYPLSSFLSLPPYFCVCVCVRVCWRRKNIYDESVISGSPQIRTTLLLRLLLWERERERDLFACFVRFGADLNFISKFLIVMLYDLSLFLYLFVSLLHHHYIGWIYPAAKTV